MRTRYEISDTGEICYYNLHCKGHVYVFYADEHGPQAGHMWYDINSSTWFACKDDGQPSRFFMDNDQAIRFVLGII